MMKLLNVLGKGTLVHLALRAFFADRVTYVEFPWSVVLAEELGRLAHKRTSCRIAATAGADAGSYSCFDTPPWGES